MALHTEGGWGRGQSSGVEGKGLAFLLTACVTVGMFLKKLLFLNNIFFSTYKSNI